MGTEPKPTADGGHDRGRCAAPRQCSHFNEILHKYITPFSISHIAGRQGGNRLKKTEKTERRRRQRARRRGGAAPSLPPLAFRSSRRHYHSLNSIRHKPRDTRCRPQKVKGSRLRRPGPPPQTPASGSRRLTARAEFDRARTRRLERRPTCPASRPWRTCEQRRGGAHALPLTAHRLSAASGRPELALYCHSITTALHPQSRSDAEHGERPGDPRPRYADAQASGWVDYIGLDSPQGVYAALNKLWAQEPALLKGAPLVAGLVGKWTFARLVSGRLGCLLACSHVAMC